MAREKYWKRQEITNSIVVDADGFVIGFVKDILVKPREMSLKIHRIRERKTMAADIEALRELLLTRTVKRKWFGEPTMEDLQKTIRQEMKAEKITNEVMIRYAKSKGVEIPLKERLDEVEEEVGDVPWSDIEGINVTELGACTLLNKSYTTKGESPSQPRYVSQQEIIDKVIIDRDAKIVGRVEDVQYSIEGLGITIPGRKAEVHLVPDFNELEKLLTVTYASEESLAEQISRTLSIPKEVALKHSALLDFAKRTGVKVPMKKTTTTSEKEKHPQVIPWREIRSVGDVVLLNRTLDETLSSIATDES